MKPNTIAMRSRIHCFLLTAVLLLTCFRTFAQERLKPEVYNNFIKSNVSVSIKTIEGSRVMETNTATLNNFIVPADKKKVISYENKIKTIDASSYEKLKSKLPTAAVAEDIKIIPELHVESGAGQTGAVAYRVAFTSQEALQFDNSVGKFKAKLEFLLMSESGDQYATIQPVKIEISTGETATIIPKSFTIDHLSIPSTVVEFTADKVTNSIDIKVMTTSNPEGYATSLKVKPRLEISTNRSKMQGFGIQETPITVRFVGSNSSDSVKVDLSAEKGTITPNSVYVQYNKSKTVYLRSEGLGRSRISAKSSVDDSNDLLLKFVFPWLFLLASILGGLIGSLAKYFIGVKEKGSPLKPIIGGVLIGLIGAVAYYGLGVSLIGIDLSAGMHELAVFAISALGAYFGISLIKLDGKK